MVHFVSEDPARKGLSWKSFGPNQEDGWLYGRLTEDAYFTGNKIAYVYSDFVLALLGK